MEDSDVYLVFDRYYEPSIKNETRLAMAGNAATRRHILNPETPIPSQKVTLPVTQNKVQVIDGLIDAICAHLLENRHMLPVNKKLVVAGKYPVPFEIHNGTVTQRLDLRTTNEEADVVIVQQVVRLAHSDGSRIEVVCDDTDVFVLLLHFYAEKNLTNDIVMSSTSSNRTAVDIKETAKKDSTIVNQFLPAHALSGCDTVSQFYGIGKGKALQAIQSNHKLDHLGDINYDMLCVEKEATSFVVACYGGKETASMSEARHMMWKAKMATKKLNTAPPLKTLPPTPAFLMHIRRAHLQAAIWGSALQPDPPDLIPTDNGWYIDGAAHLEPIHLHSISSTGRVTHH